MKNFEPLEVVDRGSETQPQVVQNLAGYGLSAGLQSHASGLSILTFLMEIR